MPPPRGDSSTFAPKTLTLQQVLDPYGGDPHSALCALLARHNDLLLSHASLQAQLSQAQRSAERSAQENDRLWKSFKASPRPGATRQNSEGNNGERRERENSSGVKGLGIGGGGGAPVRKASEGSAINASLSRLDLTSSPRLLQQDEHHAQHGSPASLTSTRYNTPPPPPSGASPQVHQREASSASMTGTTATGSSNLLRKSSSVDLGRVQELEIPSGYREQEMPRTPNRERVDPALLSVAGQGGGQFRSSTSMPSMQAPLDPNGQPIPPTTPDGRGGRYLPSIAPVSPLYSDNSPQQTQHQPRGSSAQSSPLASPGQSSPFPTTPNQPTYPDNQLHPNQGQLEALRRARSPSSDDGHRLATPYGSSSISSPRSTLASPAVILPSEKNQHRHSPPPASSTSNEPSQTTTPTPFSSTTNSQTIRTISTPNLAPHLLPYTTVRVGSSNIKVNERGKEVISFIVDLVVALPPNADPVRPEPHKVGWKIEKMYSDILLLDASVKSKASKSELKAIGSLPDKSLFKDHAPHKSDQRKAVLEKYLGSLLNLPLKDKTPVTSFFNSGLYTDPAGGAGGVDASGAMSGWLTKRGRNFGGWQTRFYKLEPGVALAYFDTKDGSRLGEIPLTAAAIGRQSAKAADAGEDAYLHAFLIRTSSEKEGDTDHILCAENDEARDAWVHALTTLTLNPPQPKQSHQQQQQQARGQNGDERRPSITNNLPQHLHHASASSRAGSQDLASSSSAPAGLDSLARAERNRAPSEQSYRSDLQHLGPSSVSNTPSKLQPSPAQQNSSGRRPSAQMDRPISPEKTRSGSVAAGGGEATNRLLASNVSGPMNAVPLPSGYEFKKAERTKKTKSSFWGFAKSSSAPPGAASNGPAAPVAPPRPVFGVPLKEAVSISRIRPGLELPAVVYRCVEYLEAKNAETEEGIFRLSGSANVIRMLKDRFNAEGDVDLLKANEYYDPHAIAGLLKLFLRELPVHILTRELHAEFIQVIDLRNRKDRVNALGKLVARLPIEEYTLFRFFFAHLCLIAQNAAVTKMNLRNLGIVFSVNLSIPAPLFTLLLTEFDLVFAVEEKTGGARPIMVGEDGKELPPGVEEGEGGGARREEEEGEEQVVGPRGETKARNRNSQLYESSGANVLMEFRDGELNTLREQADDDSSSDDAGTDHYISDHYPEHSPELQKANMVEPLPQPHARQLSEGETISFAGYGIEKSPTQARFRGEVGGLPASPRAGGFQ